MRATHAGRRLAGALAVGGVAALALTTGAWAHAELSPPVVKSGAGQLFTLAVPTEEEGATTTTIELTPPSGFGIDGFVAAPGWKRTVEETGSGEEASVRKVTWSGGKVPTGELAVFQFLAEPGASKTYTFSVRQTYSDGKVVSWSGPESSDTPAPTVEARASLGGGRGSSVLAIVALVLGGVALVVGLLGLLGGKRQLA